MSWSDTQVVAAVASGAKSGTAQILQGGVWSNAIGFTVITPNTTNVSPTTAVAGNQINITGTGFGASQGSGNVWLGSTYGVVVSWSDTQVVASVASGAKSGTAQILQGGVWSNSVNLTVSTPNITSVTPTTAIAGTQITIAGTGFGASQGSGNVWLGSTYGVVVSWSDAQVVASVASGAKSGTAQILQGGVWSNAINLTVTTPNISNVTPTTATSGTQITIAGTGFGASQGGGNVWLGSTYGVVVSWSDTQVVASVASGAKSGTAQILQGGVWSNSVNLTVSTPNITSVTPTTAIASTQITIAGTGFGASQGSGNVWLGSRYGGVVSWSDTQVVASVASGSKSGTAQILQGGVWSNSVNLTVNTPNITSVSPTTAVAGMQITITGTGFGASQGSGNIWLGSTYGVVVSWSDTQVVATVASGSKTGTAQILQGGVWSNSINLTVATPNITNVAPTTAAAGAQVTLTGTGFGASQGSGNIWLGSTYGVVVSWSETQIVATVAANSTTGTVQVLQGGVWSNSIAFTISTSSSTPVISSISPSTGGIGTAVTITGSYFGSTQGQSVVTFNGIFARISSWSDTSIIARAPSGLTAGPATIIVAVSQLSSNGVQYTVTQPLFVTPNQATLAVGQTRSMQLIDENGVLLGNTTWSFDDNTIAEIIPPANPGDLTLLQADAVGTTNFVATYGNRTGTAKITVLPAGAPFPIGTVQWSVPPLGSFGISKTIQSLRVDDNTPDLYAEDDGVYGGNGSIRALTADGQQKWIWPSTNQDKFPVLVAADDQGGAVYFANQDIPNQFGSFCYFGRVDETGNETWQYQETNCSEDYAIATDGTIFLVENAFQNTATTVITALDPSTGQVKYTVPLPASSQMTTGANSTEGLDPNRPAGLVYCTPGTSGSTVTSTISIHGSISASSDGSVFIPFTTSTDFTDAQPCDSSSDPNDPGFPHLVKPTDGSWSASGTLQLLTIHPDGSSSTQQLDANSASGSGQTVGAQVGFFGMGRAISDGQGGALLTLSSPPALYHASSSGTAKFGLPITPDAPPGDDLYIADSMLLGEDGTAYIVGGSSEEAPVDTVLAVDSNSGNVKWTTSPGLHPKLSTVTSDGSLAFQYSLPDFSVHSAFASPTGQISPLFANPADNSDAGPVLTESFGLHVPSYWTLGTWYASLNDLSIAAVKAANAFVAASAQAQTGGSEKKDHKPHIPQIVNYLPSQIEAQPGGLHDVTTNNYPCFMDARILNARRDYTASPCSNNFSVTQDQIHRAAQTHRTKSVAIVQTFRADLAKSLDALAFIGHSVVFNNQTPNEFSIGINFYYPLRPNKNPGDESTWDVDTYPIPGGQGTTTLTPECLAPQNFCQPLPGNPNPQPINRLLPLEKDATTTTGLSSAWNYGNSTVTTVGPPQYPGPAHAPLLLVDKISQQAKILFFGACALSPQFAQPNEVPAFLQMWDIRDVRYGTTETRDRAVIVPDPNSVPGFDTNQTDLQCAASAWQQIAYDLVVGKMNVKAAVGDANANVVANCPLTNDVKQPNFMVLGNPKVVLVK